jgi:hypothetical protein
MKQRLALVSLLIAAAISFVAVWLIFGNREPNPAISEESYRRIRIGMTEAEVLKIMASPPGHYARTHIIHETDDELVSLPATSPARVISWMGNEWGIVVWLDENNTVRGKRFISIWRP